jgi:hypothetical protein
MLHFTQLTCDGYFQIFEDIDEAFDLKEAPHPYSGVEFSNKLECSVLHRCGL